MDNVGRNKTKVILSPVSSMVFRQECRLLSASEHRTALPEVTQWTIVFTEQENKLNSSVQWTSEKENESKWEYEWDTEAVFLASIQKGSYHIIFFIYIYIYIYIIYIKNMIWLYFIYIYIYKKYDWSFSFYIYIYIYILWTVNSQNSRLGSIRHSGVTVRYVFDTRGGANCYVAMLEIFLF